jgi:hypothetical protein
VTRLAYGPRRNVHDVHDEWRVACSGELNVIYNVTCCQSSAPDALVDA